MSIEAKPAKTRKCRVCRKRLSSRKRLYCSITCCNRHRYKPRFTRCAACQKALPKLRRGSGRTRTCSEECAKAWGLTYSANRRATQVEKEKASLRGLEYRNRPEVRAKLAAKWKSEAYRTARAAWRKANRLRKLAADPDAVRAKEAAARQTPAAKASNARQNAKKAAKRKAAKNRL